MQYGRDRGIHGSSLPQPGRFVKYAGRGTARAGARRGWGWESFIADGRKRFADGNLWPQAKAGVLASNPGGTEQGQGTKNKEQGTKEREQIANSERSLSSVRVPRACTPCRQQTPPAGVLTVSGPATGAGGRPTAHRRKCVTQTATPAGGRCPPTAPRPTGGHRDTAAGDRRPATGDRGQRTSSARPNSRRPADQRPAAPNPAAAGDEAPSETGGIRSQKYISIRGGPEEREILLGEVESLPPLLSLRPPGGPRPTRAGVPVPPFPYRPPRPAGRGLRLLSPPASYLIAGPLFIGVGRNTRTREEVVGIGPRASLIAAVCADRDEDPRAPIRRYGEVPPYPFVLAPLPFVAWRLLPARRYLTRAGVSGILEVWWRWACHRTPSPGPPAEREAIWRN